MESTQSVFYKKYWFTGKVFSISNLNAQPVSWHSYSLAKCCFALDSSQKLPQSKVSETWAELSLWITDGYHQITTTCWQTDIIFHSFSQLPEELSLRVLCLLVQVCVGRCYSKSNTSDQDIVFFKARWSHSIRLTQNNKNKALLIKRFNYCISLK